MTLQQEDKNTIVTIRLQRAKETMSEVTGNMQLGYWRIAINRLYYACYYAASALLINNNFTTHTHAGVINKFGLHFVAKGFISKENKENSLNNFLAFDKAVIMMTGFILRSQTLFPSSNLPKIYISDRTIDKQRFTNYKQQNINKLKNNKI